MDYPTDFKEIDFKKNIYKFHNLMSLILDAYINVVILYFDSSTFTETIRQSKEQLYPHLRMAVKLVGSLIVECLMWPSD